MTFRSRRVSQERPAVIKAASTAANGAKKTLHTLVSAVPASGGKQKPPKEPKEWSWFSCARRISCLKAVLITLLAILCIALVANIAVAGIVNLRMVSVQSIMSTVGTPPPTDAYGHTNLLLLGVGDKDHDGVDLTDTIIVVSLDPHDTRSIVMLSIPRDLWISGVDHVADGRINTLYRDLRSYERRTNPDGDEYETVKKALSLTAAEISRRLNIEIHGVIKADFTGFAEAVDAVGGVDIDVPEDIIDLQYPGKAIDTFDPFRISAGSQHLDGETALKYARSRHTTSDFDRSARQQQLISAIGTKVREQGILKNPSTILTLLKIAGEHVAMTLSSSELIGLANVALKLDLTHPKTIQLSDNSQQAGGFLYPPPRDAFNGASVLLPEDGKRGWQEIVDLVMLAMHQRLTVSPHALAVENAGARAGLARTLGFELIRFGFNVVDIRNREDADGAKEKLPHSLVETDGQDSVGEFLAGLLSLPTAPLPPAPSVEHDGDVDTSASSSSSDEAETPIASTTTLVLGEDYSFTSLSSLLHPQQ